MVIRVSKPAILAFRRQCRRRYPKETIAALWGYRMPDGAITVESFQHIPHTASAEAVSYSDGHVYQSKIDALQSGMDWIGTAHSHCNSRRVDACQHPSLLDLETAAVHGEIVSLIVYVYDEGRATEVNWFVPHPPPEVAYLR